MMFMTGQKVGCSFHFCKCLIILNFFHPSLFLILLFPFLVNNDLTYQPILISIQNMNLVIVVGGGKEGNNEKGKINFASSSNGSGDHFRLAFHSIHFPNNSYFQLSF